MILLQVILLFVFANNLTAFHGTNSNVTLLTISNLHLLEDPDNIWTIYFYSKANRNQNFVKEFALSADILKGVVKFGAIDVGGNAKLTKNFTVNVKFLPAVKLFGDDQSKDYIGPKSARDIVEWVMANILDKVKRQFGKNLPENLIEELTDANFDKIVTESKEPWAVLFYAPWCLHCKEFKPIWSLAATTLQNRVKFASIDATVNKIKAKQFRITAYPTIKLLPFEKKSPKNAFDYTQDRNAESIVEWVLRTLPGPQIAQLTTAAQFQKHCIEQNICIISVLPQISDCPTNCRREYLEILRQIGEKFKQRGWGWVWSEAGAQEGLEDTLGVGDFGYPALVVLNSNKMKYSVFKGAFSKKNIGEYLTHLNKAKAVNVQGDMVSRIVTVKSWTAKDPFNKLQEEYGKMFDKNDEL